MNGETDLTSSLHEAQNKSTSSRDSSKFIKHPDEVNLEESGSTPITTDTQTPTTVVLNQENFPSLSKNVKKYVWFCTT